MAFSSTVVTLGPSTILLLHRTVVIACGGLLLHLLLALLEVLDHFLTFSRCQQLLHLLVYFDPVMDDHSRAIGLTLTRLVPLADVSLGVQVVRLPTILLTEVF